MKIFCKVHGKDAVVVGYGPGRKGRPRAIVITEGQLKDVGLKDIELNRTDSEKTIASELVPFKKAKSA